MSRLLKNNMMDLFLFIYLFFGFSPNIGAQLFFFSFGIFFLLLLPYTTSRIIGLVIDSHCTAAVTVVCSLLLVTFECNALFWCRTLVVPPCFLHPTPKSLPWRFVVVCSVDVLVDVPNCPAAAVADPSILLGPRNPLVPLCAFVPGTAGWSGHHFHSEETVATPAMDRRAEKCVANGRCRCLEEQRTVVAQSCRCHQFRWLDNAKVRHWRKRSERAVAWSQVSPHEPLPAEIAVRFWRAELPDSCSVPQIRPACSTGNRADEVCDSSCCCHHFCRCCCYCLCCYC